MDSPSLGNVREWGRTVERLLPLGEDGQADVADLPHEAARASPAFFLPAQGLDWEAMEKNLLQQALQQAKGNRTRAARLLALPGKAFLYRLEKHGIA